MVELVHGKGANGFQELVMDEVHDIKMELAKRVRSRLLIYILTNLQRPVVTSMYFHEWRGFCIRCHFMKNKMFSRLSGWRGQSHQLPPEHFDYQHFVDDCLRSATALPATRIPIGLWMYWQNHSVHVEGSHHELHAFSHQSRAGKHQQNGEGEIPQGQILGHFKSKLNVFVFKPQVSTSFFLP